MTKAFGAEIRGEWLLDESIRFLNHGSFGACPRTVLADQARWRERLEQEPYRFMIDEVPGLLREVADELGAFVGARGDDLVWVDNATTGVNAVLGSLDLGPGDEVVRTGHVYYAVGATLDHHAKRSGFRVVPAVVPFPIASPDEVVEALKKALSPRTKLAVLDHITSFSALLLPIEEMVAICREAGVPVLVDGAHAPGQVPLDLEALGADWYTGNLHKWLFAPKGCAFVWARRDRQEMLHPTVISHGWERGFLAEFDWTGTRDPSPWLSLPAAIRFAKDLDVDAMRAWQRDLQGRAAEMLAEAWGVELPSPPGMRAAMATLPYPRKDAATHDNAIAGRLRLLNEHHIEVPVSVWGGRLWLRISAQVYNNMGEYEALAAAFRA